MKRLLVLLLLAASPAMAWPQHGGGAVGGGGGGGSCPQGSGLGDGCPGTAGATFTRPDFFTYVRQSGQTYATRPPWNVAGVDYPVGITTSIASHVDPAVAFPAGQAGTHQGCAYIATGGMTGPRIECTLTADVTFSHLDLSGGRFGHLCTSILVHNPTAFNILFDDIYWENEATCLNASVSTAPYLIYLGGAGTTSNATITNSTFIGHGDDATGWCAANGSATCLVNGDGSLGSVFGFTSTGTMRAEYNVFLQWPGHTFGMNGTGTCPSTAVEIFSHNYSDTNHHRVPMGHGALGSFGCSTTQTYAYNTLAWVPGSARLEASLTTMLSGSPGGSAVGTWNVDHNVIVSNLVGGTSRSTTPMTYHLDGATGALVIDTTSGTILPGMGAGGDDVYLWQQISGSGGVGSTWRYDCGDNTLTVRTGPCGVLNFHNLGVYDVVQTPTFISTNGLGVAGWSGTVNANPRVVSTTPVALVHGPYGTANVTNNYFDNTGGDSSLDSSVMDVGPATGAVGVISTCTTAVTITGNINLTTGAAANGKTGGGPGC